MKYFIRNVSYLLNVIYCFLCFLRSYFVNCSSSDSSNSPLSKTTRRRRGFSFSNFLIFSPSGYQHAGLVQFYPGISLIGSLIFSH